MFLIKKQLHFWRKVIAGVIILTFNSSLILPPQRAYAQTILNLPVPGSVVPTTAIFAPAMIKGINLYPDNPLKFDFIIDKGDTAFTDDEFEKESTKLIKYFLSSLTVPEDEMWVNLSPYEKNRIVPQDFGKTEMGRDLLAQDYMLKQLTASLMNPDDKLGGEFWQRVYSKAQEKYGTTDIPMNTFNKIWIVPEKAVVYEHEKGAFVVKSHLKVMLEEDYLALEANKNSTKHGLGDVTKEDLKIVSGVQSAIIKDLLIPEIEKEVNEGKTFANLRQIYNSVILASWYKQALKETVLGQVYVDQKKTKGVETDDKTINEQIYNQYVESFKKGVYNYIKEDYDPNTQEVIPRKYFSGGEDLRNIKNVRENVTTIAPKDFAQLSSRVLTKLVVVLTSLVLSGDSDQKNNVPYQKAGSYQESIETDRPKITQDEIDEVVRYFQNWIESRSQDNINAPMAVDIIEAALRGEIYILTQELKDRIIKNHEKNPTDIFKMYTSAPINVLFEIPSIRQEFIRRHRPIEILRLITSFDEFLASMAPILMDQIDDYIDLIVPEVLVAPEGRTLIEALTTYKYDSTDEKLEINNRGLIISEPSRLVINNAKFKDFVSKLSAKGKIDVLIRYLLSNDDDKAHALDLLSDILKNLSDQDQKRVIDAYVHLIFNSKSEKVRADAGKILFTAALDPKYRYMIDQVEQQRKEINALPDKRASKDVKLIVFDDFETRQENGLIHGEMVVSRILTGLLGKEIDLTRSNFIEQLGLSDNRFTPIEAATDVLRVRNIELHALQANRKGAISQFTELLKQYGNNTVVANISMGGYTRKILDLEFTQEDPQEVNGSFPMGMFEPSGGKDHLIFFSAGNGREFKLGNEGQFTLGKYRIYSHPRVDQFVVTGAASINPKTGEWERSLYSDFGTDVHSYAPTGPWQGTSFSAPFGAGVALHKLELDSNMSVKTAKEKLTENPEIHKTVKYADGYTFDKETQEPETKGGIDMNPTMLNTVIEKNGRGVIIPTFKGKIPDFNGVEGFVPNIINVTPVNNLMLLLGIAEPNPQKEKSTEVSYNLSFLPIESRRKF